MFPIYKAKIVDSYLDSQFLGAGFKMLCKDRAKIRGGVYSFWMKIYLVRSSILTNSDKYLK